MRTTPKTIGLVAGLGILCAGGATFAVAQDSTPAHLDASTTVEASEASSGTAPQPTPPLVSPGPDLKPYFSVLRAPAKPASAAGTAVARADFAPGHGVRRADARSVRTNAGPIGIAPATNGVCFSTRTSGTCANAEAAMAGEAFALEICGPEVPPGSIHLYGLLPNSVTEATISLRDGTSQKLSVSDNIYSYVGSAVPASVAWRAPSGPERRLSVPLAPGTAEAQAACAAR